MSYKIKKIKNGLTLICDTNKKTNLVSIAIGVKVGSINEELEREYGISHALEHMMFKGTPTRNAKQIAMEIENLGADTNAFTSNNVTAYHITGQRNDFSALSNILFDIFCNSTFPEEELEKEKKVILEEILMYEDDPSSEVFRLVNEKVYAGSSLGHPVIGYKHIIEALTPRDLNLYKRQNYTDENTIISVSGNIIMEDLEKIVMENYKFVGNIERLPLKTPVYKKGITETLYKDIGQNNVVLTFGEIKQGKEEYVAAVLTGILSGGMSSRLFQKVREDRGLVYGIQSFVDFMYKKGVFGVYYGTSNENDDEIINIVLEELEDIANGNISKEEIAKVKNQFKINYAKGELNYNNRNIGNFKEYSTQNKITTTTRKLNKLNAITAEEIATLAKRLVSNRKGFNFLKVAPNEK